MRRDVLLGLILAFAVVSSGCAKRTESLEDSVYSPTLKSAQELATSATLSCGSGCNDSVGMLIGIRVEASYYVSERCTAFAVGTDVLLTNAHCVPEELRAPGSSCAGRIWSVFAPGAGQPLQHIECSQVLAAGDPASGMDFAVLRLSQATGRKTLPLSFEGLTDGLELTNPRVVPVGDDGLGGVIENQVCRVSFGEPELPAFNHALRQNGALKRCYSRKGNSGSPFLDAQGAVRAILFAGILDRTGVAPSGRDRLTLAVNMACVPLPSFFGYRTLPAQCAQ